VEISYFRIEAGDLIAVRG